MIFVALGTNDKKFTRLLDAVEKSVEDGTIKDRVIVQAGFTPYKSDLIEVTDYFDQETFHNYLEEADLVITHGGAGTIMQALGCHKIILAAARLAIYHEHVNDHQTQLLESFDELGYLIYMRDLSNLAPYLERARTFVPKQYTSNTANMINLIEEWIDRN